MKRSLIAALAAICLSTPAMAVTITEGIDYADAPVASLGLFGPGETVVLGGLQGQCLAIAAPTVCYLAPGDPIDRITFDVAPGHTLTELLIGFAIVDGPGGLTGEIALETPGGPAIFSNLTPGIYDIDPDDLDRPLDITISGYQANAPGPYEISWSVTATVSAVPLPGAAGLLLAAFAATGLVARRKARSKG